VVYHCYALSSDSPCRPVLEVDARTMPGDLDAGPLLVTWADYARMAGIDAARRCSPELSRRGRLVRHQGVMHVSFPTWTSVEDSASAEE
jgi:hypothetical protein